MLPLVKVYSLHEMTFSKEPKLFRWSFDITLAVHLLFKDSAVRSEETILKVSCSQLQDPDDKKPLIRQLCSAIAKSKLALKQLPN